MSYTFAVESMDYWDEVQALFKQHNQEVPAKFVEGKKFNPCREKYQFLADQGMFLIVTVRKEGELIGYCNTLILECMHYEDVIQGVTDSIFIHPDHREFTLCKNLIEFVNECLHSLGVTVAIANVSAATKDWSPVLTRLLGYEKQETAYVRRL